MDFLLTRPDGGPGHVINVCINLEAERKKNITATYQYIGWTYGSINQTVVVAQHTSHTDMRERERKRGNINTGVILKCWKQ